MSANSPPPSKLTEFAPHDLEARPGGGFFARLFGKPDVPSTATASTSSQPPESADSDGDNQAESSPDRDSIAESEGSLEQSSTESGNGGSLQPRTLTSVLKRLSNILDRRSQTPQAYRDSDFRQYWMPDSNCRECYECGDKFNTFRRRHHCRICGQIFCSRCCNQEVPGKFMGYTGSLRVCCYCCKVVLSYAQNPEASTDLGSLTEDLNKQLVTPDPDSTGSGSSMDLRTPQSKRKLAPRSRVSTIFDEESLVQRRPSGGEIDGTFTPPGATNNLFLPPSAQAANKRLQDSGQLREIWQQLRDPVEGMEFTSHRLRLRTHPTCVLASDIIDWLISTDKVSDRAQACAVGQALLDAQYLECITATNPRLFTDEYAVYKPGQRTILERDPGRNSPGERNTLADDEDSSEPQWLKEIVAEDSEDIDEVVFAELNKIPSTVSAPRLNEEGGNSGSIFYLDATKESSTKEASYSDAVDPYYFSHHHHHFTESGSVPVLLDKARASPNPHVQAMSFDVPKIEEVDSLLEDYILVGRGSGMESTGPVTMETEIPAGWHDVDELREENGERRAFDLIRRSQQEQLQALCLQQLSVGGLSHRWADTVLHLTRRAVQLVRPNVRHDSDDMDIRQYVQCKKIPGGQRSDSCIVRGVVCTKNVPHRKMRNHIISPKILLLRAPIEYQRVENKFSSLEPQILQEQQFLSHCVGRIAALQPDVLVVEKTVSRVAQDYLLEAGITVVFNVKRSIMERIARLTQAVIVTSIDGLVSNKSLGACHEFKMYTFQLPDGEIKSLMYFDGCPSHFGCTITLRGGSLNELKRVKSLLLFMLYATYHLKLELSYLMDAFAMPPAPPDDNSIMIGEMYSQSESDSQLLTSDNQLEASLQNVQTELASQSSVNAATIKVTDNDKEEREDDKKVDKKDLGKDKSSCDKKKETKDLDNKDTAKSVMPNKDTESTDLSSSKGTSNDAVTKDTSTTDTATQDTASADTSNKDTSNKDTATKDTASTDTYTKDTASTDTSTKTTTTTTTETSKNESILRDKSAHCDKNTPENKVKKMTKHGSRTSEILDFSDPLQNYQVSKDETIFHSKGTLQEDKAHKARFKKALKEVQLSISPFMRYTIPYMETERGQQSKMRKFFIGQLYWSEQLAEMERSAGVGGGAAGAGGGGRRSRWMSEEQPAARKDTRVIMANAHPFIESKLTENLTDPNIQTMMAEFRARGGRIIAVEKSGTKTTTGETARSQNDKDNTSSSNARHDGKVDCLDPVHHQKLHVLFGSHSEESGNAPNPCVSPWVVTMGFYGRNDITLGQFLERYCFRADYRCPSESCLGSMLEHTRRFVHQTGCVSITLEQRHRPLPTTTAMSASTGTAAAVLMWSWCTQCKQVTPVVPMSLDTWSMSFSKYLELRFHGSVYGRRGSAQVCPHSLNHQHHHYFGFQSVVAKFKYTRVELKEVALPPIVITIQPPKLDEPALHDEVKQLHYKGTGVYNAVWQHLHEDGQAELLQAAPELTTQLQHDKEALAQLLDGVQSLLKSLALDVDVRTRRNLTFEIHDQINEVKIFIASAVTGWNNRLSELQPQRRQERNRLKAAGTDRHREASPDVSATKSSDAASSRLSGTKEEDQDATFFLPTVTASDTTLATTTQVNDDPPTSQPQHASATWTEGGEPSELQAPAVAESVSSNNSKSSMATSASDVSSQGKVPEAEAEVKGHQRSRSQGGDKRNSSATTGKLLVDQMDGISEKKNPSKKNIFTSFLQGAGQAIIPNPFSAKEHYLLRPPYEKVPIVVYDQEPSSIIAYTLSSQEYERQLEELNQQKQPSYQPSPANSRKSSKDPSSVSSAQDPASQDDPPAQNRGSKVLSFFRGGDISREKSPSRNNNSSSNRYDVSAVKYIAKLDRDSVEDADDDYSSLFSGGVEGEKTSSGGSHLKPPQQQQANSSSASSASTAAAKSKEVENIMHIEMQFSDSSARFYCRVYFAEQFKNIRKLIFPEGEHRYIRSLSRCFTWLARGGKSGSMFCKTQDDRFILKQMSRYEVQSFAEFAPHYFNYITQAYREDRPTALAKILGVYRIGYKNSQTNSDLKQDLLVMENLFYDRKITQIYDLKGSVRNRLVSTSGKRVEELVLLDENLLKTATDNPLYIRPHSKTILTLAITQDTEFLYSHLVMDYSLLVGVDQESNELVIGIIDYIRTFTWDKKLEMVVKSTLAGQGKMPTVVSPEVYRNRFLDAMDRYFLFVPDRWTGLGANVDC